ncbi:4-hydroxy-tetrahydrodipicolinate reductase [Aliidiomarina halalkaliphila]|uniref:4-hydroxy-tetrahydrodipicolinate reductase n=1 Tax=Aliidiomarina halalkaliphila TaxID=2593535 RepID=A0A552X460_9GAMM|nr:4-hydroxy-tetrahydrodipicolinate reductase [Aliidiomarina halalkaliphila]TRW49383.1 4-hydroxy-tetrahydrodipicolinate reductase [Aliidiomarina halalkaliphila]
MTKPLDIALVGASGRMGKAVVQALVHAQHARLAVALTHADSAHIGKDSGTLAGANENNIPITADITQVAQADVVIDFGLAEGLEQRVQAYVQHAIPAVICVTGLTSSQIHSLHQGAQIIPLLHAANTSVGINLLAALTAEASRVLGTEADIEILEAHHTRKLDAPSGTALVLGEAAAQGRGQRLDDVAELNRNDPSHRYEKGSIGFATLRAGDIVGEHTVYLVVDGERIELSHRVSKRSTFADGALRAARWLAEQKAPGLYAMKDVLGLDAKG